MIDTQPEIRKLDNGKIAYFYSPHQLEEIRDRFIESMTTGQVAARYGQKRVAHYATLYKI